MGTMLQAYNPTPADFGGAGLENCNENLCLTHPEWILDIHRAYLEAGADIIETNSFQGSPIVLAEFGLADRAHELNVLAAQLARQAADEFSTARNHVSSPDPWDPPRNRSRCAATSPSMQLSDSYYVQAQGAGRRRRRSSADRNRLRHPQYQGRPRRHSGSGARTRHPHSDHGLGHHRALGSDAGRPARRRVLRLRLACRSLRHRPQLRHWSGSDDGPHPHAGADGCRRGFRVIRTPGCRTKKTSIWKRRSRSRAA